MSDSWLKLIDRWRLASTIHPNRHFWGTLFSALLLSLGAPFWFNTLKTLSGLRPILATREQKEREKKEA